MLKYKTRIEKYFALSTRLAFFNPRQLHRLLKNAKVRHGWGNTRTITIDGSKVFVKSLPITEIENETNYSTHNMYHLPNFYHYGIGSAGFGVFRELATHIKTTNWVLHRDIEFFPLMYHYRIIPFEADRPRIDTAQIRTYLRYWDGHHSIADYIKARCRAKFQLVIFLEYFPYVLAEWLPSHMRKLESIMWRMRQTLGFLNKNGIVHFDAHFHNILTDGDTPYLTDFGLCLDKDFDLRPSEMKFLARHQHYDQAELLSCLGSHYYSLFDGLPSTKKQAITREFDIDLDLDTAKVLTILLDHLEEFDARRLMILDRSFIQQLTEHREIIGLVANFYSKIKKPGQKNTRFPSEKIERVFRGADF